MDSTAWGRCMQLYALSLAQGVAKQQMNSKPPLWTVEAVNWVEEGK
jgi:hypothetical protein